MEDNISKGDNGKISNGSIDTFKRDNPVKIALFLSEKESIFKRKNWLLVVCRKANMKSQKLSLFSKMAENLLSISSLLNDYFFDTKFRMIRPFQVFLCLASTGGLVFHTRFEKKNKKT